ncbi:unnamed protein product [Effrenium voratum]|nr:unnamed protein product [Effrenium voratum]
MRVEKSLRLEGVTPTWYVDEASLANYRALGLEVKAGGKLAPARNMALGDALSMSKVCVQISDDVAGLKYFDVVRVVLSDSECNKAMQGARVVRCSFMARMRALDLPRCGGCYPESTHVQFDEGMPLKHDYDFTCS